MEVPRSFVAAVSACAMAVSLVMAPCVPMQAQAAEDFSSATPIWVPQVSTVKVYSGDQDAVISRGGASGWDILDDGRCAECKGIGYNDSVIFSGLVVTLPEDSPYYVKGIRQAGVDNVQDDRIRKTALQSGAETFYPANADAEGVLIGSLGGIKSDQDYVVAYGILANRVGYTVNYVDAEGNQIGSSETFTGDIGDIPALSPKYIEGYVPQASRLTKTLASNEGANVFTFVYNRLADGYTTEEGPGNTMYIIDAEGNRTQVPLTAEEEAAVNGDGNLITEDGTVIYDENGNPLAAPEAVNIDDEENPLASAARGDAEAPIDNAMTLGITIGLLVAVIAAILGVYVFFSKRKKQQASEVSQDQDA